MGKGSGRRPGTGYAENYDRVFASQKPRKPEGAAESTPKGLKRPEGKQEDS